MLILYVVFGACAVLAQEDPALQEFKVGNLKVAAELYKIIAANFTGNFVFTPLCFQLGGVLIETGAKGETAQQILRSLHLPATKERADKAAQIIYPALTGDNSYILDLGGKLFLPQNQPLKSSYLYKSFVQNINFGQKNASDVINAWTRSATQNKIDNLVIPSELNSQISALLAKAVVFQGNWTNQFSAGESTKGPFYDNGIARSVTQAKYIHQHGCTYNYRECGELDAKFLEMDLGKDVTLTLAISRKKNGISKLENNIERALERHDYHNTTVHVQIPTFSIDTKILGKAVLEKLGVKAVFDKSEADLSGISGNKGDLDLSDIVLKSAISVNEGGIDVPPPCNPVPSCTPCGPVQKEEEFIADCAFMFFLRVKGFIVLLGRLSKPN